jgi:alkaline phosphatase D
VKTLPYILLAACILGGCALPTASTRGPFQVMGFKIGEVSDQSAIIWTRLNRDATRVGISGGMPEVKYLDKNGKVVPQKKSRRDMEPVVTFPAQGDVTTIEGAVPGTPGDVRILYRAANTRRWARTDWKAVSPEADYTHQFKLSKLKANTRYQVKVESRAPDGIKGQTVEGQFLSAPAPTDSERVVFMVSTGQAYGDQDIDPSAGGGYKIYDEMLKLDPSFFVHTGDIVYYDRKAKSLDLAQWHWQRMYSLPTNVCFHNQVSSYFIKDDHDTWMNDCWPSRETHFMGAFTFAQGLGLFPQMVPMGGRTWRTFRWGKDLQIWLVEGRDFRSPNTMRDGPDKTIWGPEQKAWFKQTVQASDASFRILISPTPLVGPDRTNKKDNHANEGFSHEGNELRAFLASQKNMSVICGDRHWQYLSQDAKTGLREYSCGPASNKHAGGWSNDQRHPEHRYLNVTGGFLAVTIERKLNIPTATFKYYSPEGDVLFEESIAQ